MAFLGKICRRFCRISAKIYPMEKLDLKVKIGKLVLKTPVLCASGTFGFGSELNGLADFSSIGAVIAKTITLQPRAGNPPPRIYETECGVINSVGLENPGLEGFIREKLPELKKLPADFIVSVGGFSFEEYAAIVRRLDKEKAVKAFEINLSCPNLQLKKIISQDAKLTYQLTGLLRKATRKTLIIKITPEVTDISQIAKAVEDGGADGLALVNTFFAMAINIQTARPYIGSGYGGYSGKAVKPMALYRVWKAAGSVNIPVVGGGGIETADDAIEFILAGATAVSVGTQNMVCPSCSRDILAGIKQYMRRRKIANLGLLRGAAGR